MHVTDGHMAEAMAQSLDADFQRLGVPLGVLKNFL